MINNDNENSATPKLWLYDLTADEWLHLASEGEASEVAPCCANISSLREWLNALAVCQNQDHWIMVYSVLDAYDVALASHDTLAERETFPLLHRVLDGLRADKEQQIRDARARDGTSKPP